MAEPFPFYPETLRAISELLEAINAWEKGQLKADMQINLPSPTLLRDQDDTVLGSIVDRIGGVWSFIPFSDSSKE
jgi:hypothetical protein